jgi:hypothetical protein
MNLTRPKIGSLSKNSSIGKHAQNDQKYISMQKLNTTRKLWMEIPQQ